MRLKLLIVFLLIIIIPMITLGWFSVKSAQDQREIHKHRIIALITQNLARLDETISELVKSYERKLNTLDSMTDYSTPSLRKLVRSIPVVHQLLILDQRGKRIFPSHSSFTRPEHEFIRRTKPFIETFLKGSRRRKRERSNIRLWKRKPLLSSQKFGLKKDNGYRPNPDKKLNRRKLTKQENTNIRIEQHLYANSGPKQNQSTSEKTLAKKSSLRFEVMPPRGNNLLKKPANKPRPKVVINKQGSPKNQISVANTHQQSLKNTHKINRQNSSPHNTKDFIKFTQAKKTRETSRVERRNDAPSSTERRYSTLSSNANANDADVSPPRVHNKKSFSPNGAVQESKSTASVKSPLQRKKESVFQDLRGWSIGFRKKGINLIFSFRKSDGYLIAAEISRTRLIADITLLSPISKSQTENITQSRITLTNARGDIISQWGRYEPEKNSKPLVSYGLAVPLNSWKLNYFSAKIDLNNSYSYAPFALGVSAVFIAVFGLAFYFYRESNRELTVARQRVTFVNQVSHELKTPLTNIRMYAELLEEDLQDTNDKTRSRMQVIINESQRLSRMIINVLNFARHQRKQLTIIRSKRVVDDIIRHVIEQLRPALQRLNIEVEFKANASQEIDVDTDILEQILHNLISNVEKYAATGQYLGIESSIINDTIQLTLSDKGPGIPRPMIHKIFEAFYRGNNQLAEGVSGTGIGLSISRELARLHGGDLELVNSQQGITFKLTLDSKAKRK